MDKWHSCNCELCREATVVVALSKDGYSSSALGPVSADDRVRPPPWFQQEKFQRGQEFFHINFMSIFVSNLVGLVAILHVSRVLSVLMNTNKSSTCSTAARRYLSTLRHLYAWYTGDVFNPSNDANKSIQLVRQFHLTSMCKDKGENLKCRNENLITNGAHLNDKDCHTDRKEEIITYNKDAELQNSRDIEFDKNINTTNVAASQVDMVATQWAFCALVVIRGHELGIATSSQHLLSDFLHFWRTIGYLMGIEDRFNLCGLENLSSCRRELTALMHQLLAPAVAAGGPAGGGSDSSTMSAALLQGAKKIVPFVDDSSFLHYTYSLLGVTKDAGQTMHSLTGYQSALLNFQIFFLSRVLHWRLVGPALRWFTNQLMYISMTIADDVRVQRTVQIIIDWTGPFRTLCCAAVGYACVAVCWLQLLVQPIKGFMRSVSVAASGALGGLVRFRNIVNDLKCSKVKSN